ncbi:43614_t:CDS:1 [Gigaspora margarita]|uniref:43614_t:CDS:1 n=1 Tax=Gigaspora margarita TaxID=4874 RepID=A0ABM8W157_GIGMA|nr:43614_t:CDS:1 [Gigaspora margarita]
MSFRMLPTLENLNLWKPKIMSFRNCIMCGDEEKENLNHLSSCKKLEKTWKEIENFTIKLIWITTEDKLQKDYKIQDLKKLLFGTSHKEAIKTRCLYMRGLFDRLIFNQLKQVFTRRKHISEIINATTFSIQECFYQLVWRERCEKVIE